MLQLTGLAPVLVVAILALMTVYAAGMAIYNKDRAKTNTVKTVTEFVEGKKSRIGRPDTCVNAHKDHSKVVHLLHRVTVHAHATRRRNHFLNQHYRQTNEMLIVLSSLRRLLFLPISDTSRDHRKFALACSCGKPNFGVAGSARSGPQKG